MIITPEAAFYLSSLNEITGDAVFSPDNRYRYLLTREWGSGGRIANFLLCNPSTADDKILDPTVKKCLSWAITWGYDHLIVTNIFAFKSTDITQLKFIDDPIGESNDLFITKVFNMCKNGGLVVVGFGNYQKHVIELYKERYKTIQSIADEVGIKLHCLEVNKSGLPTHPLYIAKSLTPIVWEGIL